MADHDENEPLASPGAEEDGEDRARVDLELLEAIAEDHRLLAELDPETRRRLVIAAGKVSRPDREKRRALRRALERSERDARRSRDAELLDETGIRSGRRQPVFATPAPSDEGPRAMSSNQRRRGRIPHRRAPAAPEALGPTGVLPETVDASLAGALEHGEPAADATPGRRLIEPRNCYICKADYDALHEFYDALCPACSDFNWLKRIQSADLAGRVALVTGGRVKIGYQAVIKLLRAGARVIVATRFPRDAAARYVKEADYPEWRERLAIHGLDLRHTPSVEAFAAYLGANEARLDFILNNACQTVRRPPGFYEHMMENELRASTCLSREEAGLLSAHVDHLSQRGLGDADDDPGALERAQAAVSASWLGGLEHAAALSQVPLLPDDFRDASALFPAGALDQDLQQVDLREKNSWRLRAHEVSALELLEVHLVNAVAPFVLNARLKPLMLRAPGRDKHIVNVSAMEGQFYRTFKTDKHPHTNMAKASLNMLTRTSAQDYFDDGIHMNSVDTGWITDEDPVEITLRKQREHGFHPPLDIVDAAARICDPIFSGLNTGHHVWGQFLKDYAPTDW